MALFGMLLWAAIVLQQTDRLNGQDRDGTIQDYVAFYAAAELVSQGRGEDLYSLDAIGERETRLLGIPIADESVLPYLNPPFVAAAFAPLTALGQETASLILFALNLLLVVLAGLLLEAQIGLKERKHRLALWISYLSMFWFFALFLQLQLSILIFLAWGGFIHFQRKGRDDLSALSLALGLVKPQTIVLPLLYLLYRRRFRALAPFATVASSLVVLSLLIAGPTALYEYPRFLIESARWEHNGVNAGAMYGLSRLATFVTGDQSPSIFLGPLSAITLVLVLNAWRSARDAPTEVLLPLMALTLTGMLLANPHLYLHDLAPLSLVCVLGAVYSNRSGAGFGPWPGVTFLTWFLMLPLPRFQVEHGGLPLLTVLMLAVFMMLYRTVIGAARSRKTLAAESTLAEAA